MNKTEENWALVFTINDDIKAEMIIQSLEEAGIQAVKMNKKDSMYHVGDIEIFVRLEDLCVAKNIVKDIVK